MSFYPWNGGPVLKVPFAINEAGVFATPSDVKAIYGWKLKCAECEEPVILRGETSYKVQAHFAHLASSESRHGSPRCSGGETAIHKMCKAFLAESTLELHLPDEKAWITRRLGGLRDGISPHLHLFPKWHTPPLGIQNGRNEVPFVHSSGKIRPDVVVETPHGPLAIEIKVTSGKSEDHERIYRELKMPCIEIDMSEVTRDLLNAASASFVQRRILEGSNRRWIFSFNEAALLECDAGYKQAINKMQSARTKKMDIPLSLVTEVEKGCGKGGIFIDPSGREITVTQSLTETCIYEPSDGQKYFDGSKSYPAQGITLPIDTWSPVYKAEIRAELSKIEDLEWILPAVESLEEVEDRGIVDSTISPVLVPNRKRPISSVKQLLSGRTSIPQHTISIMDKNVGTRVSKSPFRYSLYSCGPWEIEFPSIEEKKHPSYIELCFLRENSPVPSPISKVPAPLVEVTLLRELPTWIHWAVRRIELINNVVECDFYLGEKYLPFLDLNCGNWVHYLQLCFSKRLRPRWIKNPPHDNGGTIGGKWFFGDSSTGRLCGVDAETEKSLVLWLSANINNCHYLENDVSWSGFKEASYHRLQNNVKPRKQPLSPDPVQAELEVGEIVKEGKPWSKVLVKNNVREIFTKEFAEEEFPGWESRLTDWLWRKGASKIYFSPTGPSYPVNLKKTLEEKGFVLVAKPTWGELPL